MRTLLLLLSACLFGNSVFAQHALPEVPEAAPTPADLKKMTPSEQALHLQRMTHVKTQQRAKENPKLFAENFAQALDFLKTAREFFSRNNDNMDREAVSALKRAQSSARKAADVAPYDKLEPLAKFFREGKELMEKYEQKIKIPRKVLFQPSPPTAQHDSQSWQLRGNEIAARIEFQKSRPELATQ